MPKTGVICALIRDKKVLMQQRDGNCKRFPFAWCLPGGGSEGGEEYIFTLIREVKEEYDISLHPSQCTYLMDYDNGRLNKVFFCRITSDQNPVLKEGLAMKWMTIPEIEDIELGFNQKGIIPKLKMVV
jgi:8-oxo-dGTP pyrophosphatase MutT (NUDIX family)